MPNKIITPPDLDTAPGGCLIINADQLDVELLARWLPTSTKEYTVYLYHEDMRDITWVSSVAPLVDSILISNLTTNIAQLHAVLDCNNKITWFGSKLKYQSPVEYFIKHD